MFSICPYVTIFMGIEPYRLTLIKTVKCDLQYTPNISCILITEQLTIDRCVIDLVESTCYEIIVCVCGKMGKRIRGRRVWTCEIATTKTNIRVFNIVVW